MWRPNHTKYLCFVSYLAVRPQSLSFSFTHHTHLFLIPCNQPECQNHCLTLLCATSFTGMTSAACNNQLGPCPVFRSEVLFCFWKFSVPSVFCLLWYFCVLVLLLLFHRQLLEWLQHFFSPGGSLSLLSFVIELELIWTCHSVLVVFGSVVTDGLWVCPCWTQHCQKSEHIFEHI